MDKTEQIKSLLYSHTDWQTIGNKEQPYHIEIQKNSQFLYYFGANHSREPQNFQYPVLKKYWQDFLEKTNPQNAIVLVESGLRKLHENEDIAIRKDSENGLITLLARQAGVSVSSPDPKRYDERQELIKQFSKEEVQYYYFARTVNQWLNIPDPRPDFKEYINWSLKRDEKDSQWLNFDFSLANMELIHKTIFDTDFSLEDKNFFSSIINPTKEKSIINKVSKTCSTFRNIHVTMEIDKLWNQGKNIFVVFGVGHLILQEPALRKLLAN